MSEYYKIPQSLRDHWDGTRAKEFGGPKFPHKRKECRWCINHAEVTGNPIPEDTERRENERGTYEV